MKISMQEVGRLLEAQGLVGVPGDDAAGMDLEGAPAGSVRASAATQEAQQVKGLVDSLPDIREDVVQDLRSRIQKKEYDVSSAEIADLMVRRAFADRIR